VAVQPVEIDGRVIARTFWGKAWCDHLESFSDFANRLPRGRTYARNGSVCHLAIAPGKVEAIVSGSELYKLKVQIDPLPEATWREVCARCAGKIGSLLGLLAGKLSDDVMSAVTDRRKGLFPQPGEIHFRCSCPDWATMCKHVAAVMYGVGHRLDARPEMLFALRQVDHQELISTEGSVEAVVEGTGTASGRRTVRMDALEEVFGIDLDDGGDVSPSISNRPAEPRTASSAGGKEAPKRRARKVRPPGTRAAKRDASGKRTAGRITGKSVARMRKRLGMSVSDFAELVGVSPASVYRWESQRGRLRLHARTGEVLASLPG